MDQQWGRFWVSIGLMSLAGAIAMNSLVNEPIEVGALAQWASAVATVAAVVVALRNTHITLRNAEEREHVARLKKEESYTAAIIVLSDHLKWSLDTMDGFLGAEERSASLIKRMSAVYGFNALIDRMDKIPIHECHNVVLIEVLSTMRLAAHNAQVEIDTAVEEGVDAKIGATDEIELHQSARDSLKETFSELFKQISIEG